jgi:shikimate dehydrogenase
MTEIVKLGLLGDGIGRSRAKLLHELIGEIYGIAIDYRPMDLAARKGVAIRDELLRCRNEGFQGVNVTHPYKREAFHCVELLDGFPPGLASINTVLFRGERMLADNTDYSGLLRAFDDRFGAAFRPGRVLVLGTGGVGLAILFALHRLDATELVVHDSRPGLARKVVDELLSHGLPIREASASLVEEMRAADGLVNATPVGMFQYPGMPFPADGIDAQRWVFDAVYTPENTEFLAQCRRHDIEAISGFKLFLYQGLDAFHRFTGIEVDAETVQRAFLKRYPFETPGGFSVAEGG